MCEHCHYPGIRARGRNNWFTLHKAEVVGGLTGRYWIEFRSSKPARDAPMQLSGSKENLRALLVQLLAELVAHE